MDRSKLKLLFNTIKYLKPIQIYYRLFYFVRNRLYKNKEYKTLNVAVVPLQWQDTILHPISFLATGKFSFLNLEKDFKQDIDWEYQAFGKLWVFNLNYFDFLNQQEIAVPEGVNLIKDYIAREQKLKDGKAAYPISLRGINWVKFLSKHTISDSIIDRNLFNHYQILLHNLEYHLLGNHLLENGFALLFGGYYFKDDVFYKQAVKILKRELKEQVLKDGGHFELSPMYHQTMLYRVLDCIQLIRLNPWREDDLILFLEDIASKMLGWLKAITFENGDIPMVNDSSFGIAPSSLELLKYGRQLGMKTGNGILSDSGYRMVKKNSYELFIDIGHVGASYQPAHAHSDTFNFVLYVNKQPVFVDTGVSTYEKNTLRQEERSTAAHNTVQIGLDEQTQVWGGFRVANRAGIIALQETENTISATHDGYKSLGVQHTRCFHFEEKLIKVVDTFSKAAKENQVAHFHLHPSITNISIVNDKVLMEDIGIEIIFNGGVVSVEKASYKFAQGFNKTVTGIKLKILFTSNLETTIKV